MDLPSQLKQYQARINNYLETCLPNFQTQPTELHTAMRYAVLGGGKRIRAMLVYLIGEALNGHPAELDKVACTVELIHAYSLVHDDLPAMDDDALRHGKPTCHKAFGEALAILTGDALQSLAFALLAEDINPTNCQARLQMIKVLADAIGSQGMVGGQVLDLAAEGKVITLEELENIHRGKTGALIMASIQLGALASNQAQLEQLAALKLFAQAIGLAFQIQDDIIDVESSTEVLGKQQGADLHKQKATYPALIGMASAKAKAAELHDLALQHLKQAKIASVLLEELIAFILQRHY